MGLFFKNAILVTMNREREVIRGGLRVQGDRVAGLGPGVREEPGDRVIDAGGRALIPGLIQSHVHLCQTLFRGQADDLELMDWLKLHIWPLEGSHDPDSLYYSALLGCGELFKGGTTGIIDMATVHHTGAVLEAIRESGIRAITGKCMMDGGEGVPGSLGEETGASLEESVDLLEKWHNREGGRIRYAFAPRFALSCTPDLLREVGRLARHYGVKVHTHASENRQEVKAVREKTGLGNIQYLQELGLLGPDLVLAHCIWLDPGEEELLVQSQTSIAHCPSSNLKLASGIARVPSLLSRGASISLGSDGAPCNNNLDQFMEMRLAALIQKPLWGPAALPAREAFEMATRAGARAMGLEEETGSLEPGKKADLALVDLEGLHTSPEQETENIYARLVYQARSSDVIMTVIDGRVVMEQGHLTTLEEEKIKKKSTQALKRIKRMTRN